MNAYFATDCDSDTIDLDEWKFLDQKCRRRHG